MAVVGRSEHLPEGPQDDIVKHDIAVTDINQDLLTRLHSLRYLTSPKIQVTSTGKIAFIYELPSAHIATAVPKETATSAEVAELTPPPEDMVAHYPEPPVPAFSNPSLDGVMVRRTPSNPSAYSNQETTTSDRNLGLDGGNDPIAVDSLSPLSGKVVDPPTTLAPKGLNSSQTPRFALRTVTTSQIRGERDLLLRPRPMPGTYQSERDLDPVPVQAETEPTPLRFTNDEGMCPIIFLHQMLIEISNEP